MSRNWTNAQKAAMSFGGRDLLVSAAAGSGKTATLTERIIRRITDETNPADISSMLVVTFTRAAAQELKSRIFSALSDALAANPSDTRLTSQLMKLGSAHICTIDAFYADLVRSHFSELGISASFRIADSAELAVLSEELWAELVDEYYETEEDFPLLVECFQSTRGQGQFIAVLSMLYEKLRSRLEGLDFLRLCAEEYEKKNTADFFQSSYGTVLRRDATDTAEHLCLLLRRDCEFLEHEPALNPKFYPAFEKDLAACEDLLALLQGEDASYEAVRNHLFSIAHLPIGRQSVEKTQTVEQLNADRQAVKKALEELRKKGFAKEPSMIGRAMKDTGRYLRLLHTLLLSYDKRLTEEKQKRSVLEFNDIRRYAFELMVDCDGNPTKQARAYAEQFSEIYIDEYQDVDRVQDMIFSAISRGNNRFMVGDIKQSIYRFRGAEPQVFSAYRSSFVPHDSDQVQEAPGATVFMSENFRCDRTVIDFTNAVCSYLFSACADSIGYCAEDDLVYAKPLPKEEYEPTQVKLTVVLPPEDSDSEEEAISDEEENEMSGIEREAYYIAAEIEHLLNSGECRADGKKITPGDIAVLVRTKKNKAVVAEALTCRGIPTAEDDASRYFENPDVQMMLCILNTVDNPRRDIELAGAMRSPIFRFTMDDLLHIRACGDKSASLYDALLICARGESNLSARCRQFLNILEDWRDCARSLPIDRFLRVIFDSEPFLASGLLTQVGQNGEGGNLLRLYEYARTFESASFRGLYQFIEFINKVIEQKKDLQLPGGGSAEGRVSVMTIHHSKGLEFPVCFVSGMGANFSRQESKESMALDHGVGIAMKLADGTGFARINTPMREAILSHMRRMDTEEELRVLYVALTRARERLYVSAYAKSTEDALLAKAEASASYHDAYTVLSAKGFLSWILAALAANPDQELCQTCFLPFNRIDEAFPDAEGSADVPSSPEAKPKADEEEVKRLTEAFSFTYPYADFGRIPAKISVSRLSPDVLDEEDSAVDLFEEKPTAIPDFFLPTEQSKASSAERGTATHLFLQFCNFSYAAEHGVDEELARLTEKRFLPESTSELVYREELARFLESELIQKILTAKQVYREQRFNLLLSPANFTRDEAFLARLQDEKLAVQGVMDLVFVDRDDQLWLIDYKTDRLSRDELADPALGQAKMSRVHGRQLSYYAMAAELLFDRPCDRLCIYSTHAARLYDITPQDLRSTEHLWDPAKN